MAEDSSDGHDPHLYCARIRAYQHVVEMLRFVCSKCNPEITDLPKFSAETAKADFLFGPEIPKYIDENL